MVHLPPLVAITVLCFCSFLVLPTIYCNIPDILNINCGSSESSTDGRKQVWVGDEDYVRTGEAMSIVSDFNLPAGRPELRTLRVFTSRVKNCYTIPTKNGTKILARAYFYYGNYDSKNSPPEMELVFDANSWVKFTTTMDDILYTEMIYVTKRNSTSICLVRTNAKHDPFISSLEVRILPSRMYIHGIDSTKALRNCVRNAYGASSNTTISYPDDAYDRFWDPVTENYTVLKSDTTVMDNKYLLDEPPNKVLFSAVAPPNGTNILTIPLLSSLPDIQIPVYCNLYFTEMSNLNITGERRSFDWYIDGSQVKLNQSIVPPYQSVIGWQMSNALLSSSSVLSFRPTSTSTLPPIISALEVHEIIDMINPVTRDSDVSGLSALQERFQILKEWSGDPCFPVDTNWEWVKCSAYTNPSVTQLMLAGYGLQGHRLPDFTALSDLEVIDLHNNSLTGPIPEFFNNFPKLHTLNLGYNDFTSIPASLLNNKNIDLSVEGNAFNTSPGSSKNPKHVRSPPNNEGNKAKAALFSLCFFVVLGLNV